MFIQPTTTLTQTHTQTDSGMQCLYSQPLHSHRLTVACNVYTANHYTHTDTHTDWQWHAMFIQPTTTLTQTHTQTDSGMQCLYSQPLHSHRLTVACNVYTANHYTNTDWQWHAMFIQPTTTLTQTDTQTDSGMQCLNTANHNTDSDRHTDWQWHAMFIQPTITLRQTCTETDRWTHRQMDTQTDVAVCESTCSQKLSMTEHSDHMDAWQLCAAARLGSAPSLPPQYVSCIKFYVDPLD